MYFFSAYALFLSISQAQCSANPIGRKIDGFADRKQLTVENVRIGLKLYF